MENIEMTLLKQGETLGSRNYGCPNQLEALTRYGVLAANTDLAIATGSNMPRFDSYVLNDRTLRGRTGMYVTQSTIYAGTIQVIMSGGEDMCVDVANRGVGIRPVIRSKELTDFAIHYAKDGFHGTKILEYGEYPQYVVKKDIADILEKLYERKNLQETGKTYTFDSRMYNESIGEFEPVVYAEYVCGGKKFVRILANPYDEYGCKLSNGVWYNRGDAIWLEVSPVEWLIDEKSGSLISLRNLVSGIRFANPFHNYDAAITESEMYRYMNTIMKKDLFTRSKLSKSKSEMLEEGKRLRLCVETSKAFSNI